MRQCNNCGLAFPPEQLDQRGNCASCAAELAPAQQQPPAPDPEKDALKAQLQQTQTRLQMVESSIRNNPQQQAQPDVNAANKEIWANPAPKVAEMATYAAQQQIAQAQAADHDTMVAVARDKAREQDPELFDKYVSQINQIMTTQPPQYHRNVNVWSNVFKTVIGQNYREIMANRKEAENAGKPAAPALHLRGNDGPAAVSPRQGKPPAQEPLPDEARRVMKILKLDENQMRRGIEAYESQDDSDMPNPSRPSPYDKYITFDSSNPKARKTA